MCMCMQAHTGMRDYKAHSKINKEPGMFGCWGFKGKM